MPATSPAAAGLTGENLFVSSTKEKQAADAKDRVQHKDRVRHDDFLKLLTAQLTHQDPLKPMDDTQFISQMAQLQALDQQIDMTETMAGMRLDSQLRAGSELIGQYVRGIGRDGNDYAGLVASVLVKNNEAFLQLHTGASVPYKSIQEIKVAMAPQN